MLGSTILDVGIGLIFFYFLLSTITLHLNEFIAARLKWRANDLEKQIRHMLGDPELANKVLQSPMITSITAGKKPSYIPANTFALALFDAFVPEGETATALDQVEKGMASLPTNRVTGPVTKIVNHANGNMKNARAGAEEWFNAAMDRLSGAYKRKMQALTLLVSLLLTSILGADSLVIINTLYKEPALRAAVTGSAQAPSSNQQIQTNQSGQASAVQQSVDSFLKSGFPLGWGDLPTDATGWFKKVIGLLITALAVSLGAPFWFNILQQSIRLSGRVSTAAPSAAPGGLGAPVSAEAAPAQAAGMPPTPPETPAHP